MLIWTIKTPTTNRYLCMMFFFPGYSSCTLLPPALKLSSSSDAVCNLFPPLCLLYTASSISSPCWGECDKYNRLPHQTLMAAGHVTIAPAFLFLFFLLFLNTHTHKHTHTHAAVNPRDSDGSQLLRWRKLWCLYEDLWGYFTQDQDRSAVLCNPQRALGLLYRDIVVSSDS